MKPWTRMDKLAVGAALLLLLIMSGHRLFEHLQYEQSADLLASNLFAIAGAVHEYHEHTDRWLPERENGQLVDVYPDPFDNNLPDYQGLHGAWLRRENNFGMVVQLVRFDQHRAPHRHLFDVPFQENEPYLRILLDYASQGRIESELLIRLQDRLPDGALAQVDDHYFVIDLRELRHGG